MPQQQEHQPATIQNKQKQSLTTTIPPAYNPTPHKMQIRALVLNLLALVSAHAVGVSAACSAPNGCFELSAISVFEPSSRPGHIIRRFEFEVAELGLGLGLAAGNGTAKCEAEWSRLVSAGYPQSWVPCDDDEWSWYVSRWGSYRDLDVEVRHVYDELVDGETVAHSKKAHARVVGGRDDVRCDYTVVGETTCWWKEGIEVPVYEATTV